MKRALVLGGGGNVGIAWETAVLSGLLDGGIDARDADLIIGTSAGSVVGTNLAHGRDPRELASERQREQGRALPHVVPDTESLAAAFTLWASFDTMTPERCAQVGAIALRAKTMPEPDWVASFAGNEWPGWPEKPLLVTTVDCETGEFLALDRASGVPIERAVAASCSVPGLFPPVAIDGRRCTDGGVRSGTSCDLAQRIEPDVVLVLAPLGWAGRGIHVISAKLMAREAAALEAAGAKVRLIEPDGPAREAMGQNMMDPQNAGPAAERGREHGRRLAGELREVWGR